MLGFNRNRAQPRATRSSPFSGMDYVDPKRKSNIVGKILFVATVTGLCIFVLNKSTGFGGPSPFSQRELGVTHVLVTGGAGYIGSHAALRLLKDSYRVTIVDNLSRGNLGAVNVLKEKFPEAGRLQFIYADLGDPKAVNKIFAENAFDAVIHFAAVAYVGESTLEPLRYYHNITSNTLIVLEAMAAHGVKTLIYSSTCATYGEPEKMPITEETRQIPINPYGKDYNPCLLPLPQNLMALVVICGQPCSGKSTAALCLAQALQSLDLPQTVKIVDESSFHLDRNQNYIDMTAEKILRGVLRSEVDRSVSKDSIVIVDSLNSIKGYRYELWCLARAAGIRYCVIYLDMEEGHCREWNKERGGKGDATYDDKIFEDLVRRFEKPDKRNRWDSPLFELCLSEDGGILQSSAAIVDAVSYLTKKADSKSRDVRLLQPTIATQNARVSEANSLYVMDRATQEVINAIVEAQSQAFGGPVTGISLDNQVMTINIQRPISLPELRSLRRTFIKLTGQSSLSGPPPPSDADSAKRMFVDYLNREMATS